ncbi:MAG: hypothetical protein WCI22_02810 [Actinomycetota bacterium]
MPADDESTDELIEVISDPVDTARRRHGSAGAILAAGMFGVDIALGRKPKQDAPIVVSANSEPVDIDTDGIRIPIDDDLHIVAPALPPSQPAKTPPKRKRR